VHAPREFDVCSSDHRSANLRSSGGQVRQEAHSRHQLGWLSSFDLRISLYSRSCGNNSGFALRVLHLQRLPAPVLARIRLRAKGSILANALVWALGTTGGSLLGPASKRVFNTWINEHDVGLLSGCRLLLIMDVFEHAFMINYGLKRADYIEAFFKNIDWKLASSRLKG
jgi:hypothetical protein